MKSQFKVKNYTTDVPAERSIQHIEKLLMDFGATNINKQIENSQVKSISFILLIDQQSFAFRLPANVGACQLWLRNQRPNSATKTLQAQAERLTWKHQHEWLHIMLTGVEFDQLSKLQALMPYCYDPTTDETFYDKVVKNKFQLMLPGSAKQ